MKTIVKTFIAILALLSLARNVRAEQPTEYELKAAYLFNFVKFVAWPAEAFQSAQEPIIIGVLGRNPFRGQLQNLVRDKRIKGRRVLVKPFKDLNSLQRCHLLFIADTGSGDLRVLIERLKNSPVLTVSELSGFARKGGMIKLYTRAHKVRFEINHTAVRSAGLEISSRLLRLAKLTGHDQMINRF